MEESLRKREEEVQQELSLSLRDREKEQEKHSKDEAVQLFNALLADLVRVTSPSFCSHLFAYFTAVLQVRDAEVSWRDARKQLRKDQRYEVSGSSLDKEEKEKLFETHVEALHRKNKDQFHRLLDDTPSLTLTSRWKEIKKAIKEDPRYTKFSSSDRVQHHIFLSSKPDTIMIIVFVRHDIVCVLL